jgi:uncharacterized phiE125 gp8 family phage protein
VRTSLKTLTPPTTPVATVAQLKAHVLVEHDLDDDWFEALESAAARLCEAYTGRRFGAQTCRLELDGWPADERGRDRPVELEAVPVSAVSALAVVAADGGTAAVSGYRTWLDHNPPLVLPPLTGGWPALTDGDRVRIDFACGGPAPPGILAAVLLTVGFWYRMKIAGKPFDEKLPPAAVALIDAAWVGRYV